MKSFAFLLFLVLIGFGLYWTAGHYVIRTDQGVVILTKRFLNYQDTFVDIRTWKSADFDAHPKLKRALIDQGYRELLTDIKRRELRANVSEMVGKAQALASDLADKIEQRVQGWLTETNVGGVAEPTNAAAGR